MLRRFVVVVTYCCCFALVCQRDPIKDVLNGLEKVLDYVHANRKLMNLDAVFGLVIGQAQMAYITTHNQVPDQYRKQILTIEAKLATTLEETKKLLDRTPRNFLFMYTVLVVEAWMRNITFVKNQVNSYDIPELQKIDTYQKYTKLLLSSTFKEHSSDDCMIELLQQQKFCCVKHTCLVSHECYKTMKLSAKEIDPAYGVTHSLLFLQVARSQMCKLNEQLTQEKIRMFCSYILWELRKNAEFGFLETLDDLFLEQVTLCGYEGFGEFFTNDVIEHIISMQRPSGCFSIGPENKSYKFGTSKHRGKRESNVLSGNCIDHTTGLGLSTLALTLRFLIQQLPNKECEYPDY